MSCQQRPSREQPARKHVLCVADVTLPPAPCHLLVRLQCDIDNDVIQHCGEQSGCLFKLSSDPLWYTKGGMRTSVSRESSRSALAMLLATVRCRHPPVARFLAGVSGSRFNTVTVCHVQETS